MERQRGRRIVASAVLLTLAGCSTPQRRPAAESVPLPVTPTLLLSEFKGAEGIAFNAEGRLFVGANNGIWIIDASGKAQRLADVDRHLGQLRIGRRDILAADFGPTNAFEHGSNSDGLIWRVTPQGVKSVYATGIGDPNAILRLPGGTYLVTDDTGSTIYRLQNGKAIAWSTEVPFANGMALSRDGRTLFVAQTFNSIKPVSFANQIWAIPIRADRPAGPAAVVARTEQGPDGLTADEYGRIYVADNMSGKILRFDPQSGAVVTVATGIPGVASLAFGEGDFDRQSLYATTTQRGGGKIWQIRIGVRGATNGR